MKIGIFCPNWVGDLVMATPALRSLRNEYPQSEIVAILRPHLAAVLDGLTLVDRVIVDPSQGAKNFWSGLRFARSLRSEKFDLVLADIDMKPEKYCASCWRRMTTGAYRVPKPGSSGTLAAIWRNSPDWATSSNWVAA